MPTPVKVTLVLTGIFAGKTVNLNGHQFEHGRLEVVGSPDDIEGVSRYMSRSYQAHPEDSKQLRDAQERQQEAAEAKEDADNGQRDIEGADNSPDPEQPTDGDVQPAGEGPPALATDDGTEPAPNPEGKEGGFPSRNGHEDPGLPDKEGPQTEGALDSPVADARMFAAIMSLDPRNDQHWTDAGLPALAMIEQVYGDTGVTRTDVEAAAPGYIRPDTLSETESESTEPEGSTGDDKIPF